ncbi:MAG: bifunctional 2-polyprenyl-6-hydroxyphenol methylase/3-demethylubiquinol 3-O-methyltransferase UbiG [Pseudomonadales bacterium]
MISSNNVDPAEIQKFEDIARRWWDPSSEFKPLHQINPLRMHYISERTALAGKQVLDIGCGGGLLTEALARAGAQTTGIDMGTVPLQVAKLHRHESNLEIDYIHSNAEDFAIEHPGRFDVVTCLEMLEHVPDPASIIRASRKLLKPGGDLFISTINRNPKSYLFAIVGAEYVLNLLPRGTHDFERFIRPSELAKSLRETHFQLKDVTGMTFNVLRQTYSLGKDTDVNYLMHARHEP